MDLSRYVSFFGNAQSTRFGYVTLAALEAALDEAKVLDALTNRGPAGTGKGRGAPVTVEHRQVPGHRPPDRALSLGEYIIVARRSGAARHCREHPPIAAT